MTLDSGWAESAVMTVGCGAEDQGGFERSSVALPGCTGASSIDRSGTTMADGGLRET